MKIPTMLNYDTTSSYIWLPWQLLYEKRTEIKTTVFCKNADTVVFFYRKFSMRKGRLKSHKYIGMISLVIFIAIAVGVLSSSYYMNMVIKEEEDAENRRIEYMQLGEQLADASDYLTAQVRYFAITGDEEHLYNYWYEIYEGKQRDYAITVFESSHPPKKEQKLLKKAKEYSDLLVETETLSMKLTLLSFDKTPENYRGDKDLYDYVVHVYEYPIPKTYRGLSKKKMREAAIRILYDGDYEICKNQIMDPIDEFQEQMQQRLNREVQDKKTKTQFATIIQVMIAIATIGGIAFLMEIMNRLYIKPLDNYTKEISHADIQKEGQSDSDNRNLQVLEAKIVPGGAMELVQFANAYNHMIDMFFGELCQRRNAEESMKKARNEAELANQAKSIFLAQMSHELRTPLNAVNGYTYLLERTNLSEQQDQYVENIRNSSTNLLELINEILDFSKIDMGHLEFEEVEFSLKELVVEIQQLLRVQAKEKELYLNLEVDEQIPEVLLGDPLRLRQVLMNLVGNGIKFTEYGGVTIQVGCEGIKDGNCLVSFEIRDTGIGISQEAMDKIFQPFTQSDASITRKYGGTGLGLPISSQIVSLSGDKTHRIKVESKLKEGSVFSFQMDYKVAKQRKCIVKMEERLIDCSKKTFLLVDDSKINIQVQRDILQLTGAKVLTALGGKQALELLQGETEVDLVLMDIRMPEMDGYEATRRLRSIAGYEKVPVLALTADATQEVERNIKLAGMDGCILKPIKQEQLFQTIRAFLGVGYQEISVPALPKEENVLEETEELFKEKQCLKNLAGNENSLLQIMRTFFEIHKEDDKKLILHLKEKLWKEAEELLHLLKGVAGNLCCESLSKECDSLRKKIKENPEEAIEQWDSFFYIWKLTLEQLEHSYEEKMKVCKRQEEETKETYTLEQAKNSINRLMQLCMDYDTEVVKCLEKSQRCLQKFLGQEVVEELKQYSRHFDFETMERKLQEIKEKWEVSEDVSGNVSGG